MRRLLKTILSILDGSPRSNGRRERGQSLLEMAFIAPLLIIMVIGTVEIGWYANHYLILLEVTRLGARSGTVLTGDLSHLNWAEPATVHPIVYELDAAIGWNRLDWELGPTPPEAINFRSCAPGTTFGFYNFIACAMVDSMSPLTIKGRDPATTDVVEKVIRNRSGNPIDSIPFPDDIVISVFSVAAVNNDVPASLRPVDFPTYDRYVDVYSRTFDFTGAGYTDYRPGFQMKVVGRYPRTANECNVYYSENPPAGEPEYRYIDSVDPFDFITNNFRDTVTVAGRLVYLELADPDDKPELQRGFVWTGQHQVRNNIAGPDGRELVCFGSEFTDQMVEELLNSPRFIRLEVPPEPVYDPGAGESSGNVYNNFAAWEAAHANWQAQRNVAMVSYQERASFLPQQGLVLVEMFWMHDILINFPFLDPIVRMFGDTQNIVIEVWAAFPIPSAEPRIIFGLP